MVSHHIGHRHMSAPSLVLLPYFSLINSSADSAFLHRTYLTTRLSRLCPAPPFKNADCQR